MLISLRIPDALLAEVDAEALADDRSRNSVLLRRIKGGSNDGDVQRHAGTTQRADGDEATHQHRSGDGGAVPVVRPAKGVAPNKPVHAVQPMRGELVQGGRPITRPTCPHKYFSVEACRNNHGGC